MKRIATAALVALALILTACSQAATPTETATPNWLVGQWEADQASVDAGWNHLHVTLHEHDATVDLPQGVESEADGFRSYTAGGFLLEEGDNGYLRLTYDYEGVSGVVDLLHVREGKRVNVPAPRIDRDSTITAVAGTDPDASSEIVPAARDLCLSSRTRPARPAPLPLSTLASKASAVGRRGLQRSLDRAAELLTGGETNNCLLIDWTELRYQHVAALRAVLLDQGAAPTTINHILSAVRGVIREAWRLGYVDAETKERVADVGNVKASTLPKGRHVDVGEIRRLFEVCGDAPVGARDAAMLALLYGCGLRRSEAVADAARRLRQTAPLPSARARDAKNAWSICPPAARRPSMRGLPAAAPGPVRCFAPSSKGGNLQHRGITAQALMKRLRYLAAKAHVEPFTPTRPSPLVRRGAARCHGADISSVQQLAGHAS